MKNIINHIIICFNRTIKKNKSPTTVVEQLDDLPTSIKDIDKEIEKAKRNLNLTKKF